MKKFAIAWAMSMFIVVSSCSRENIEETAPQITEVSEVAPFVTAFIEAGRARGMDIPDDLGGITFEISSIRGNTIGYCSYDPAYPGHIVVDEEYWRDPEISDSDKEMLIFHELGHCYLNRDHDDEVLANGTCESLMHTDASDCDLVYADERSRYWDEFFATGIIP